jgi:hypothetical protein
MSHRSFLKLNAALGGPVALSAALPALAAALFHGLHHQSAQCE